jgi:pimeloyl-ACP methyl ester carboxylesterase
MDAPAVPHRDLYWRSADGLQLHARDYPAGDPGSTPARLPVVCIPGLTRNSADFHDLAQAIARGGRRVLAVDLRGRARSQYANKPSSYNASTYAQDVLSLLREQDIARAVFVGTSLGVLVTMTIAWRAPGAVAAAVLNDAGPEVPKAALARIAAYAGKPLPPMSRDQATAYVEDIGKVAFPHYTPLQWAGMVERMFRVQDDGLLRADYDPAIVRTTRPLTLWLLRPLLWRAYRKLARAAPVLILRGQLSDVLAGDTARRMAAVSPQVRLVEVAGVGHAPDLSEASARDAILALLYTVE